MNRDDTNNPNNPKNPPQSLTHPQVRNAVLWAFVGSIVVFFALVAGAFAFWTVAHPRPAARQGMERVVGASGYYSTEGGHDPVRPPRSTREELQFRGPLTPPSEVRGR